MRLYDWLVRHNDVIVQAEEDGTVYASDRYILINATAVAKKGSYPVESGMYEILKTKFVKLCDPVQSDGFFRKFLGDRVKEYRGNPDDWQPVTPTKWVQTPSSTRSLRVYSMGDGVPVYLDEVYARALMGDFRDPQGSRYSLVGRDPNKALLIRGPSPSDEFVGMVMPVRSVNDPVGDFAARSAK